MSAGPDPLELLEAARRSLVEEVAPGLPDERRYAALLAANAVAIAARELGGAAEAALRAAARAAAELLGEPTASSDLPARQALTAVEGRLAAAVRDGAFDPPDRSRALLAYLRAATLRALGETNPGLLRRRTGA